MGNTPLYDTTLTVNERAKWIVSQLTIDEKISMFAGHAAVERLGLKEYRFGGEAAHGLQARSGQGEAYPPTASTSFTQPIGMAASWDKELIKKVGNAVGKECRAFYNMHDKALGTTRWAPTVDLCRDPRWGRNEEGYGEDPYLTGKMAGAYVEGIQDEHNYDGSPVKDGERGDRIRIGCNLKHFYANNVEWRRCYDSVDLSDKVKYDYELEPFRYCIEESHAEGLMTAYNGINGVTGMLNHEVQDICKDKWGMKHAVCDGGAFQQVVNFHHDFESHAETLAASVKAGVDNMLDNPEIVRKSAKEAYERGLITEEEIDKSLLCMFESRIRLGAFDEIDPYDDLSQADLGANEDISKKMSEASNVLLKNENGFLPLNAEDDYAVIGPCGNTWYQDWYGGKPVYTKNLIQGIEEITGNTPLFESGLNEIRLKCGGKYVGAEKCDNPRLMLVDDVNEAVVFQHIDWGWGCNYLYSKTHKKYVNFNEDGDLKLETDIPFRWYIFENLTIIPSEGAVRSDNPQNANMIEFDKYWDGKAGDVKIYGFGARAVFISDGFLKGLELEAVKAMVGSKEGQNVADIYDMFTEEPVVFSVEIVKNGYEEAKKVASSKDKVIIALGCNPVINAKEEIDRKSINMIPYQENLVKEILSVNKNVVVVLMTNYPYAIKYLQDNCKAIIMNATGSQDMGYGIASAVFGKTSPAGRVPMTWYLGDEDLVEMTDYDLINNPRTYRYFDKPVLYPFGYGLTYSSFEYSDMSVNIIDSKKLQVSFVVANTGDLTSDDVAEVYIKRESPSETIHPIRRLIGFERLYDMKPDETREVILEVNPSDIAIYSEIKKERIIEPGKYAVYVGSNCLDEAVSTMITI